MKRHKLALTGMAALAAAAFGTYAYADHAWNNYHWSVSIYPKSLDIGDNVSSTWDPFLAQAVADWNQSDRFDLTEVTGQTKARNCRPTSGRIEVCSDAYGYTGWLGIAQIWLDGPHITQAVTKLNDSYYALSPYSDDPAWRALVACQEIGHDFGLTHQDEDFSTDTTSSCMDYTNLPQGNEHPDAHDYEELQIIYNHTHTDVPVIEPPGGGNGGGHGRNKYPNEEPGGNARGDWGKAVAFDAQGRPDTFVKQVASGHKMVTHVFWALDTKRSAFSD